MAATDTKKCQCSQCGSTDFTKEGKDMLRCVYCHSLFRMLPPAQSASPKVVIKSGANVVFGQSGKVTIGGGLLIENGANVQFLGTLEIIERSDDQKISEARLRLQKPGA